MTLPVLVAHVAARWAVTRTPAHGWVPDESETDMSEHETTVTDDGHTATCHCGWRGIRWPYADGSAYTDAARHERLRARPTVDEDMVERALRQSYGPKAWQEMCDSEDDCDVALVAASRDDIRDTLNAALAPQEEA